MSIPYAPRIQVYTTAVRTEQPKTLGRGQPSPLPISEGVPPHFHFLRSRRFLPGPPSCSSSERTDACADTQTCQTCPLSQNNWPVFLRVGPSLQRSPTDTLARTHTHTTLGGKIHSCFSSPGVFGDLDFWGAPLSCRGDSSHPKDGIHCSAVVVSASRQVGVRRRLLYRSESGFRYAVVVRVNALYSCLLWPPGRRHGFGIGPGPLNRHGLLLLGALPLSLCWR